MMTKKIKLNRYKKRLKERSELLDKKVSEFWDGMTKKSKN